MLSGNLSLVRITNTQNIARIMELNNITMTKTIAERENGRGGGGSGGGKGAERQCMNERKRPRKAEEEVEESAVTEERR